ncbi:MAG: cell division protein FtsL [Brasilonema angustatum HA4187-MV1]|jgi:hypothetical protein|nr:cell division protein FtsL [Brasilonema angustatum HA4187-MV1]
MSDHKNRHLFVLAETSMSYQERLDREVQQLIQQALREHSFFKKVLFLSPIMLEHKNHHIFVLKALLHSLRSQASSITSLISLAEQLPGSLKENNLGRNLCPYYYEALKTTEADIIKNIEKFSQKYESLDIANATPEVVRIHFIRWYNMILKCDCYDKWRSGKNKPNSVSLNEPLGKDGGTTKGENIGDTNILPPLEQAIFDENKRQKQLLLDYLRQDPDQTLHNCGSKKYPDCNCWEICKRYYLQEPPEKWEEIPKALNVPYGTLTPHWYRKCIPLLRDIAKKFGFDAE